MYEDRRPASANTAMTVARTYEIRRGATLHDVSVAPNKPVAAILQAHGLTPATVCSADLISIRDDDVRVIEVKGRGGYGPIDLPERQIDTLRQAGHLAWLYVVWNTTQPQPEELWIIHDPARLEWQLERAAEREPGTMRGVRHEACWRLQSEVVHASGTRVR